MKVLLSKDPTNHHRFPETSKRENKFSNRLILPSTEIEAKTIQTFRIMIDKNPNWHLRLSKTVSKILVLLWMALLLRVLDLPRKTLMFTTQTNILRMVSNSMSWPKTIIWTIKSLQDWGKQLSQIWWRKCSMMFICTGGKKTTQTSKRSSQRLIFQLKYPYLASIFRTKISNQNRIVPA